MDDGRLTDDGLIRIATEARHVAHDYRQLADHQVELAKAIEDFVEAFRGNRQGSPSLTHEACLHSALPTTTPPGTMARRSNETLKTWCYRFVENHPGCTKDDVYKGFPEQGRKSSLTGTMSREIAAGVFDLQGDKLYCLKKRR